MSIQSKPLISVILPVYNGQKFLASSIESILNQKFKDFELIIVDDCSTDTSPAIIQKYAAMDKRIRARSNSSNLKLPKTLNVGHELSRGDYVTWTSDDNLLKENFLEVLLEKIVSTNCDLVYADFDTIDSSGKVIGRIKSKAPHNLIYGSVVGAAFLYKRAVFIKSQGYDENLFRLEDYDFWLRSSLHSTFCRLPQNIYQYRKHEHSLSSEIQKDKDIQKTFQLDLLKSMKHIGERLDWHFESARFFVYIHLHNSDSFKLFLANHRSILRDLKGFQKALGNDIKEVNNLLLWEKVRGAWFQSNEHLNMKTLLFIYKKYPDILFHKEFSKKNSLRLIAKCLL